MNNEPSRIFLAEDNTADVWLIEEALRRQSIPYELDRHETAEAAISAVRRYGAESRIPDLLLLDYNLPGGRGVDILAAAAANPALADVPKAILSSFVSSRELAEAIEMGATCFLEKPATLQEFMDQIGTNVRQLLNLTPTDA